MSPNKWQDNIWSNGDLDYLCISTSPGFSELTFEELHQFKRSYWPFWITICFKNITHNPWKPLLTHHQQDLVTFISGNFARITSITQTSLKISYIILHSNLQGNDQFTNIIKYLRYVSGTHPPVSHNDIITWKWFPHHWPFMRGINQSLVDTLTKNQ